MATLADVKDQLEASNEQGEAQRKELSELNANFSAFLREINEDDSQELEDKREAAARGGASTKAPGVVGRGIDAARGGLGSFLGFGAALGAGMLKRGIPGLIGAMFADEIADYVYGQTGSEELSDGIGRAITFGGIGLIFGKRFAILSAAIGALLTPKNKESLEKLGEQFKIFAGDFDFFGAKLPDLSEMFTTISTSFGNTLDNLRGLLGDKQAMSKLGADPMEAVKDLGITIASLFALFAPGAAMSLALKALTAPFRIAFNAAKGVSAAALGTAVTAAGVSTAVAQNAKPNRNFMRNSKGQMTNLKGVRLSGAALNTALQTEAADKAAKLPNANMESKFPKLKTFMKFLKAGGPLSALFGAADLAMILASPGSIDSKIGEIGGSLGSALGGLGGFAAGATLGGLLTGPLAPIGAIGGGLLGALAGSFGGDAIGMAIAQYLFDKKVDAFGFPFGFVNDMINGSAQTGVTGTAIQSPASGGELPSVSGGRNGGRTSRGPTLDNGMTLQEFTQMQNAMPGGRGGSVSVADMSTNVTDMSTSNALATGFSGSVDPHASMYGSVQNMYSN